MKDSQTKYENLKSYVLVEDERITATGIMAIMSRLRKDYRLLGWIEGISQFGNSELDNADLILSETVLPDGNAPDAFRCFGLKTPVVFFSSYERERYDLSGLNVSGFLLKPVKPAELYSALETVENN